MQLRIRTLLGSFHSPPSSRSCPQTLLCPFSWPHTSIQTMPLHKDRLPILDGSLGKFMLLLLLAMLTSLSCFRCMNSSSHQAFPTERTPTTSKGNSGTFMDEKITSEGRPARSSGMSVRAVEHVESVKESSQLPGSKPPRCHNECLHCRTQACVARPSISHSFPMHAVWTCSCIS
ncbi:hypothetical protein KP509_07G085700 [Ceratopteris richardii]|uniref:Epidermal patterning factor-like protein n=1 Tax=Ceratopteris richardii TaxID=49495 RepID=A0A8T2UIW8_CERRI|nr:hypothetical protein KP509_07G085700 [Ceratopteris richardii]